MTRAQTNPAGDAPIPPPAGEETSLTVTVKFSHGGMFISAATKGRYHDPSLASRFWSTDALPPAQLAPGEFWAPILGDVGAMIGRLDDD